MAIPLHPLGRRKKILVLISYGGGGHKTAGEALQQILGNAYDVEINPVISDILGSIDYLNRFTRGHFTGEDLYNTLLRGHRNKLLRWMVQYGKHYMKPHRVEKEFEKYLSHQAFRPDLIISPTPYINYGIACAAHRWDIPFLIIPTDLDGSTFLLGFPHQPLPYRLKVALAYDELEIKQATLQQAALREDQVTITGFPVRPACMKKYTREELKAIRAKFHLFESHRTLTLMMGAVGGELLFDHVKALNALDPCAHGLRLQVNICTGQNQKMATKLRHFLLNQGVQVLSQQTFLLPSGLVMHLRGYIQDIVELMAASDLIITKTGSCTVNEAIYLGKKLLLDNTTRSSARHLLWEKFNIPFVQRHRLGHAFTDSAQLLMLVPSLLKYPEPRGHGLELPNFEENILHTVHQMLS